MVRSPTCLSTKVRKGLSIGLALAIWFLKAMCMLPNATAQPGRPFLVSSSRPLQLPTELDRSASPLTATQIGQIASRECGAAKLIFSNSKSSVQQSGNFCIDLESQQKILRTYQSALACRMKQAASAQAMKLHYGIAACMKAEGIFDQTLDILHEQEVAQNQLAEKGIPIPDPSLVVRLKTSLEDKRLENQSKMAVLRSQLSALIGSENACGHAPFEPDGISPSDCNVCEHIDQALAQRCDLVALKKLKGMVNAETIDSWESIGAAFTGMPVLTSKNPLWTKIFRVRRSRSEVESAVVARQVWIDQFVAERSKQISMEVDVAFERKRTAALRWVNAGTMKANWSDRIHQLESLSEVQGNLALQFESRLNLYQSEGLRLERWTDWHLANLDLMLAIGCDLEN